MLYTKFSDDLLIGINHTLNTLSQLRTCIFRILNTDPLSAKPTKWSDTLKQFVGSLPTNCLSVFDHFVGLALKGLYSRVF